MHGLKINNAITKIYSEGIYNNKQGYEYLYDNFPQNANSKIKWSRQEVNIGVIDFLSRKQEISQREFAKENGILVPRFKTGCVGIILRLSHFMLRVFL